MSIEVLRRHIVVTCRRNGETIEVWIPADAGQGDRPDTAKPFAVVYENSSMRLVRDLTPEELRVVERI